MQVKNEDEIEEIHRMMELQMTSRHIDFETKCNKFRDLIDKLGDALYPSETKCSLCGSLETRTSLDKYNRDSGEKIYIKTCDTCGHGWLTTELE